MKKMQCALAVDRAAKSTEKCCSKAAAGKAKRQWEKPALQDVSGEVMAQPYIRFT